MKKRVVSYLLFNLQIAKHVYFLDLSIRSMLERLVLKNVVERTSQRLKWTSGARVMNFVFNEVELSLIDV